MANVKISDLPIGTPNSTSIFPFVDSGTTYQGAISAITSNIEVTYSELVNKITGETLSPGTFYTITDFRTCYDQPDFTWEGNSITEGNYKQSDVEPIVVFATSANTISTTAYQPLYPNDRIQYDWTFSATEVTQGVAYGRITERIDEFNNRTDYDHRTILFKRYRLYTYRQDQPLNGTIALSNDGTVEGDNTSFELLEVGDVIYVPSVQPNYYEITSIDDDTNMTVSGDTIGTNGSGLQFYKAIEETNGTNGYFSYRRTNVQTYDFIEYTTFGDAISENYAKNNYIGNYANNYTNVSNGDFILANNVFLEGQYESNKFGNYCYNNTFGDDNQNNIWGDYCYQNVSTSQIYENIIGHYFDNNIINTNFTSNNIDSFFESNRLLGENGGDFDYNIIGNNFNNNLIYSQFYRNEILDNFNDNVIGNFNNLDNFEFYRNYIRNNFNENIIREDFQNNQIGTNFQENTINGEFKGNVILNGYNNNTTGNYFNLNNIGNAFSNNTVYDDFNNNTTNYGFDSNVISSDFSNNNIGNYFENNEPSNSNLFGWNSLSTVSARTYDTLRNSLNNNVGNYILGKELVMKVISTSQYFKIKFTQWTQGGNGGGFQYERQELDSNGNTIGSSITFTKTNYGSEVDVIVEGVVELTRDSQGGLYNTITDTPPFNNGWPGPSDTEWNSIYTVPNNGRNFQYNKIGNESYNNIIGNDFQNNQIGDYFENNDIANNFRGNVIGLSFQNNTILDGFGFGGSQYRGNKIGNYFYNNDIGEYFYDNIIADNFESNEVSDLFQWNIVNTAVNGVCLSTGMLYDITTVNVFKNKNGDNKLSYYDELDVLTIETLTEAPCLGGLNALDIPENDLNFGLVINPSFTITSYDFTFGNDIDTDTTPLGPNGTSGFTNTASQNSLYDGYYGQGLSGISLSQLTTAYNNLGLSLNDNVGRLWYVTWGPGSTIPSGIVKFGAYNNGENFEIQTIDTSDTNYLTPNTGDGTSLVGTFLFPATFTIYQPLTDKNGWC